MRSDVLISDETYKQVADYYMNHAAWQTVNHFPELELTSDEVPGMFIDSYGMVRRDYLATHPEAPRPKYLIDHKEQDPANALKRRSETVTDYGREIALYYLNHTGRETADKYGILESKVPKLFRDVYGVNRNRYKFINN